jgi:FixJ family two-component response regulator
MSNGLVLQPSVKSSSTADWHDAVVYVVDDEAPVRRALATLMRSVDMHVETFSSPEEFLQHPRPPVPSCLILDVRLRNKNGLTFQKEILQSGLRIPVVFMTGHGDIEMTVKAMKAGAMDFFAKPFRDQDMLDAIGQALARDATRLQSELALAELRASYETLSPREREVVPFLLAGLLNKQIASEMSVSEITVKVHLGQVMRKLKSRSLPDLVRKAEALGIEPHEVRPSSGTSGTRQ